MGMIFNKVSYGRVNDVTFSVNDGKILGVSGDSNSGIRDVFDLLTLMVNPIKGKIIGNYNKIGYISYDVNEQFYDNIGEEFYFALKMSKCKDIDKRVYDSLKMVGLDISYLNRSFSSISFTEKLKVRFALALCINPDLLVLYEPLIFDKSDYDYFFRLILMMKNKYKKTFVLFSKDTDMLFSLCDNIVLIKDGSVLRTGDKYGVLTDEKIVKSCGLNLPKTVEFSDFVLYSKKIDIGYRDDINDLLKDIFRSVR